MSTRGVDSGEPLSRQANRGGDRRAPASFGASETTGRVDQQRYAASAAFTGDVPSTSFGRGVDTRSPSSHTGSHMQSPSSHRGTEQSRAHSRVDTSSVFTGQSESSSYTPTPSRTPPRSPSKPVYSVRLEGGPFQIDGAAALQEAREKLTQTLRVFHNELDSDIGKFFQYPTNWMGEPLVKMGGSERTIRSVIQVNSDLFEFNVLECSPPSFLERLGNGILDRDGTESVPTALRQACTRQWQLKQTAYSADHYDLINKSTIATIQLPKDEKIQTFAAVVTKVAFVAQLVTVVVVLAVGAPLALVAVPLLAVVPAGITWWVYSNRVEGLKEVIEAPKKFRMPVDPYDAAKDLDLRETRLRVQAELNQASLEEIVESEWTEAQMWNYDLLGASKLQPPEVHYRNVFMVRAKHQKAIKQKETWLSEIQSTYEASKKFIDTVYETRRWQIDALRTYEDARSTESQDQSRALEHVRQQANGYIKKLKLNLETAVRNAFIAAKQDYLK